MLLRGLLYLWELGFTLQPRCMNWSLVTWTCPSGFLDCRGGHWPPQVSSVILPLSWPTPWVPNWTDTDGCQLSGWLVMKPTKKKKESIFFFFAKPNRFEQNVRFWFEGGCGGVNPLSSRKYGVIMKQELKRRTKRKPKWGRWWGTKHEQKKLVELQKKGQAKELWRRREVRLVEERIRISKRGFYIKPIRFGLGWGRQTNNLYVTPWPDRCWTSKLLQIPGRHLSVINLVSSGLVGFFRSRQAFGNFFHPWCTVSPISLYFCRI